MTSANIVIVGSGIVGCSAAYHLAQLGARDILVVDKGELFDNDGSTSHAPGGVVALSHSKLMTQMALYSSDLFKSLHPYKNDQNSYNAVGGLEVALSKERWADLQRLHGEAQAFGGQSHLLSPSETKEKLPYINDTVIEGSLFAPQSAIVKSWHLSAALARDAAIDHAVNFVGQTEVIDIEIKHGRVVAVITNNPELARIDCQQVLLCTNIWGPILGDKLGINLPLLAYDHQYVITKSLPELARFDRRNPDDEVYFPTMRELDSAMYYRKHWDCYGIGSYWHRPIAVRPRDLKKTAINPFTPSDFAPAWEQAQQLMPLLKGAELETKFNGMFAFSVDGYPIMGESHIRGLWTAVASWITHSGGVGKSIAEWMITGETEWDMRQASIDRFQPFQTTEAYVTTICNKNYREVYDIVHPAQPLSEPRNIRLTPFHHRLQPHRPSFTAFAGLELPNWLEANVHLLETYEESIPQRQGWAADYWSPIQGAEHLATRDNVALYDLTGLSIIEIKGPGALAYVDYLCSNYIDQPIGQVIYTLWLTPSGGIKRDLTVARLASDQFWLFVGEGTLPQDLAWTERHAPQDGSVTITNISDSYSALGLWGPQARQVLSQVTSADLGNDAFPFYTAQWIEIGTARVFAMRISYAGELGWELHIPMDASIPVWDKLWSAGRNHNMIVAGMGAFDSLRLEKGYRLWGRDIYTEYSPYEAGLGWTVKLKKAQFIGREACLELKKQPLKKKLCCLTLEDPQAAAFGYEPIFDGENCIGHVTTGNYGYSIGKYIIYAYLPAAYGTPGQQLTMGYFDQQYVATVTKEPVYDPRMQRMRS